MQEYKAYRHSLFVKALNTLCHWSFHETLDSLQNSIEFNSAVQYLEQDHRGILRLYINFVHDFRTDAITRATHIKTYEISTTDGHLLNVLSTAEKIREYPLFKEVITVNDVYGEIIWLSAEDEELHIAATDQFNRGE